MEHSNKGHKHGPVVIDIVAALSWIDNKDELPKQIRRFLQKQQNL